MLNNFSNLINLTFFRDLPSNAENHKRNQQWNNAVDKFLSPKEQFIIGSKLALEQYKATLEKSGHDNPILVLRNPEQIANNILRHAFNQMVKTEFIPQLYSKIQQTLLTHRKLVPYLGSNNVNHEINSEQYTLSEKENTKLEQKSKEIMEYIKENIPMEMYSGLKECYTLHKSNKPELAQKDFINLIMFQFITSALLAYSKKLNNIDNPSPELRNHRLIPLALKNIYTTGGIRIYNKLGELQNILNPGFGNGQFKYTEFITTNLDSSIPLIQEINSLLSKLQNVFNQIENDKIQELMESFGVLKLDVSFKQAFKSNDVKRLSTQFKKTMECYTANAIDTETFKNIIETLANKGCPSAIHFKGYALMGQSPFGSSPYELDREQGVKELLRLKEGDKIFHHINVSEHPTYWKKNDITATYILQKNEQMQNFLSKNYKNIYDLYLSIGHPDKCGSKNILKNNILHWGIQARNLVHSNMSTIRMQQIALLQDIIDSTTISAIKKIPLLFGVIEVLKRQIGKPFVKSRLIEIMDKLLQDLSKKYEEIYGKNINTISLQEKHEALSQYLNQANLNEKFKQSLHTHNVLSCPQSRSFIGKLSQKV